MIAVSSLTHSLGHRLILDDISVDIPRGKITALIGPNGAGKSTLLHLISRQDSVQTGVITLDEQDIAKTASEKMALRIAVVAQDLGVASRLRVRDLVAFGRWPQHQGRPTETDKIEVERALEEFHLLELSDRFLDEISGGQRQRAFVAMAYVQDTDWLLLDEPLNNLDIRYAKSLMAKLRNIVEEKGKSIVIVIHDLNYALANADFFIAVKEGKIAFAGETSEVATSKTLSELYDAEVNIIKNHGKYVALHH
ncbi:iron ABC transporter ATP-binding protein [Vibrio sp. WJH972]